MVYLTVCLNVLDDGTYEEEHRAVKKVGDLTNWCVKYGKTRLSIERITANNIPKHFLTNSL